MSEKQEVEVKTSTSVLLFVQIIGETGVGKTYLSSLFPKPFMIDTSAKGDSEIVFKRLVGESSRYKQIKGWTELVSAVKEACERRDVSTVIIDTGSDLQLLAEEEYLRRISKPGKERISALQIEYGRIRDIIDLEVIYPVCSVSKGAAKNLVMTLQMKPLYKKVMDASGNVTVIQEGRQANKYERLDYAADIKLYIFLEGEKIKKRHTLVVKNRFLDQAGTDWIPEVEANYQEVRKLIKLRTGEMLLE